MIIKKRGMLEVPYKKINSSVLRAYTYEQKNTEEIFTTLSKKGEYIYLPRNLSKAKSLLGEFGIVDETISKKIPKRECYITLRNYQEEIVTKLFNNIEVGLNDNIIKLDAGGGKTFMLAYVLPKLQEKTIIIVDQTMLVEQMFKELSTNTDLKIGILDKSMNLEFDVVITTYQFLNSGSNRVAKIKNEFGLLVVDEVHTSAAKVLTNIVQSLNTRYRIGLSATPTRSDGLDEVLYDLFENMIVGHMENAVKINFIIIENWRI